MLYEQTRALAQMESDTRAMSLFDSELTGEDLVEYQNPPMQ
jgi:hypothetical protein